MGVYNIWPAKFLKIIVDFQESIRAGSSTPLRQSSGQDRRKSVCRDGEMERRRRRKRRKAKIRKKRRMSRKQEYK